MTKAESQNRAGVLRWIWIIFVSVAVARANPTPSTRPASSEPAISGPQHSAEQNSAATTVPSAAPGASAKKSDGDLADMSLEDLMNVQVTSVSKQPQKASETPAAVTVIGPDDISRSGLQSVPELLRLVPGMDVAQFSASDWAIGARGFNDVYSNKLQVLNDGRSVYNPAFSGVFWDMQEPLLADLDRIEVIRGPGATIYGSNAVDGVVNITSKSARDTQGVLVTGLLGDYEQSQGVRYGGQIDDKTFYRVYEQYQKTDDFPTPSGNDGRDGWQGDSAGFRIDRYSTSQDTITFQGDAEYNREGLTIEQLTDRPGPITYGAASVDATGVDVLARFTHHVSESNEFVGQVYFDFIDHPIELSRYRTETGDIDLHQRFALGDRQEVIVGGEYRFMATVFRPSQLAYFSTPTRDDYIASAFVQDDLTVIRDHVHLIAGTKLEETSLGGFDVQPNGRLLWTPDERNTVWASVSRAVRTPSEWEKLATVTSPQYVPSSPVAVEEAASGQSGFTSETLLAYELGYRLKPFSTFSVDVSAAYNHYDDLRSYDPGQPAEVATPVPHIVSPSTVANDFGADTYALEVAANWQVLPSWRIAASYSLLVPRIFSRTAPNTSNTSVLAEMNGASPENQFQIHSYLDIMKNLQLNGSLYYVDALPGQQITAYFRTDINVAWRPLTGLDLKVGVQNLFDNEHPEFNSISTTDIQSTQVPRTFYAQVTYRF